jgi:hypothetical protein
VAGFTRRDYIATAEGIRRALNVVKDQYGSVSTETHAARSALSSVAMEMAEHFARDNPNFDARLFYTACGLLPL